MALNLKFQDQHVIQMAAIRLHLRFHLNCAEGFQFYLSLNHEVANNNIKDCQNQYEMSVYT